MNYTLKVSVGRQGLYDVTHKVADVLQSSGLNEGLITLFVRHTSASLLIQENADPSAREDLERWLNRLVPEDDALYTHTMEGPDDMPAHIKATLCGSTLNLPVSRGRFRLGTWQGIYLCEFRNHGGPRRLVVTGNGDRVADAD